MSPEDEDFERRTKADLRRIVADTSPELRARIAAIAAMAAREAPRPRSRLRPALVPLGGVAALALVIVGAQMLKPPPEAPVKSPAISADDVALLLNVDNLDLLEQMEFYLWLDREPGVLDAESADASQPPRRS